MERSIHEMLKDAPSLNESENAVHTGTPPPHIPNNHIGDNQPRPATINLTLGSPTSQTSVSVSPSSPIQNGDSPSMRSAQSKIESIKNWSISTYKCTKQIMYEKLGKTSRTVDSELETQIDLLRDTQKKYCNVLRLSRALASHFHHVVQTQHALGEAFSELAQKSPELQEEFLYNSETQRSLTKNGETLLGALNFFVSSVNTLCNKTIEDTLLTVRQYETARLEYDAYRTDLEILAQAAKSDSSNNARLEEAHLHYEEHKENFEKLRSDVSIKLKFLDENRVKVMHKQLLLFHNAISAYFSGNQTALEATLKQFNIKISLTLWKSEARKFDGSNFPVVAIRASVRKFNRGKALTLFDSSIFQVNPDISFKSIGIGEEMRYISSVSNMNTYKQYLTFQESRDLNLGYSQPDYYFVKATIEMVETKKSLYKSCPTKNCMKKLII